MLNFGNAPGAIFNCTGKMGLTISQMMMYQAAQLVNLTDTTNGVVAQYNNESDLQALIGGTYIGLLGGPENVGTTMQNLAQQTWNRKVFRDNPQINQTLTNLNVPASIQNVILQMQQQGATVLAMTVTATPGTFVGVGNSIINASVKRPVDGLVLENTFAESVLITCTSDSYSGTAQAGNEVMSVVGTGAQTDFFAFNWPLGSGATSSITNINGNANNSQGNILTNSGYETWTGNTPNNYTITVGASTITKETTLVYDGTAALQLTGDGSTLTSWQQRFGNNSGTLGTLSPETQYSHNAFLRRDGVAAASGQLAIELIDSTGVIINDNNNVPNQLLIDLTALTITYTAYKVAFRTPTIMPSTYYIRYRLTSGHALTNGRAVYIDKASLGAMRQMYTSGPFYASHAGSIPLAIGDYENTVVTNSRGVAGTLNTFQTLVSRLFGSLWYSNEFLLPSSSSPSVSDSLIG